MSRLQILEEFEASYLNKDKPKFNVGDTLKVHILIIEGKKERIQTFTGTVIAKRGSGLSETFTLYRQAYGCTMERVFLINSPRVTKVEIIRQGKVRRAKLNYLKGATGKSAKVLQKIGGNKEKLQNEEPKEKPPVSAKEKK